MSLQHTDGTARRPGTWLWALCAAAFAAPVLALTALSLATPRPAVSNTLFGQQTQHQCGACHTPGQETIGAQGLTPYGAAFNTCIYSQGSTAPSCAAKLDSQFGGYSPAPYPTPSPYPAPSQYPPQPTYPSYPAPNPYPGPDPSTYTGGYPGSPPYQQPYPGSQPYPAPQPYSPPPYPTPAPQPPAQFQGPATGPSAQLRLMSPSVYQKEG